MGYKLDRDEYSLKLRNVIGDLVGQALTGTDEDGNRVKKATKYLSPTLIVSATYVGKPNKRDVRHHINVHIGNPNYAERQFIKTCKKAKEPFPVKKIQLKFARPKAE